MRVHTETNNFYKQFFITKVKTNVNLKSISQVKYNI